MCFQHSNIGRRWGAGLNDNTALVICQGFSFDGKGCREPASQSLQHTEGIVDASRGFNRPKGKQQEVHF